MLNLSPSRITTGTYSFVTGDPIFSPAGGTFANYTPMEITITSATPGASIYYTTDRSDPTTSSTLYTSPITLTGGTIIKAKAYYGNWTPSNITTETYIFEDMSDESIIINNSNYSNSACYHFRITPTPIEEYRQSVGIGSIWAFYNNGAVYPDPYFPCEKSGQAAGTYLTYRMGYMTFNDVQLEQGQVLPYAYLKLYPVYNDWGFHSPQSSTDKLNLEVACYDAANGTLTTDATTILGLVDNRTTVVSYDVTPFQTGQYYDTCDVSSCINQVLARPDWVKGNRMTFVFYTEGFAGANMWTDAYWFYATTGTDDQRARMKVYN